MNNSFEGPVCSLPLKHDDQIILGHGSGGRMTQELINRVFMPNLSSNSLVTGNDFGQGTLPVESGMIGHLAISTDSHIVKPIFFPGGDIGKLAVCGTVNDISMSGGIPIYLTAGFILEEGFSIFDLSKIAQSMKNAADEAGIQFIAGDTKVVEKGSADGVFINTSGIGWIPDCYKIGGQVAQSGDIVIISGTIGDHGIAVLAARGDLGLETDIQSDIAPLNHLIRALLHVAPNTHTLRDPTRGGLATTLNEIAVQSKVSIWIDEDSIPVNPAVRTACEMLGFDPLYVANEGKMIVIVPPEEVELAMLALKSHPYGINASRIGVVRSESPGRVVEKTTIGGTRLLDMLTGEMLPRIC
jgi:hydrogenase expression/formation protein HypE